MENSRSTYQNQSQAEVVVGDEGESNATERHAAGEVGPDRAGSRCMYHNNVPSCADSVAIFHSRLRFLNG